MGVRLAWLRLGGIISVLRGVSNVMRVSLGWLSSGGIINSCCVESTRPL